MADEIRNIGASVRGRLLNIARKSGTDFQLLVTRYVLERLLYRLSISQHREEFILKGAMLFAVWLKDPFRNTRDLDLLARGEHDAARVAEVFREICAMPVADDDGVSFDIEKLTVEPIRENEFYGGIRITTSARVGGARVPVRVDIGFGDAVTPRPVIVDYPALLDLPRPRLMTYPRETVVAEKFEAMVALGLTNSRMKDFHDIALLATSFAFEGPTLAAAISATFKRRGTAIPTEAPLALTDAFVKRPETIALWNAFVARESILETFADLGSISETLLSFLLPPAAAASTDGNFDQDWSPGAAWRKR